jgi:hypothetical protein
MAIRAIHIDSSDERRAERRAASRVEVVPDVQVVLNQLRARLHTEVEYAVVLRVDAVGADGHHDISVAGEDAGDVSVPLVTRDDRLPRRTRPREAAAAHAMTAVQEDHERKRPSGQIRRAVNLGTDFNRPGEAAGRVERGVTEVVFLDGDCQRTGSAWILRPRRGAAQNGEQKGQ